MNAASMQTFRVINHLDLIEPTKVQWTITTVEGCRWPEEAVYKWLQVQSMRLDPVYTIIRLTNKPRRPGQFLVLTPRHTLQLTVRTVEDGLGGLYSWPLSIGVRRKVKP